MLTKNKTKPIAIISYAWKEYVDFGEINEALVHIQRQPNYPKFIEVDTGADEYAYIICEDNMIDEQAQEIYDQFCNDLENDREGENWE